MRWGDETVAPKRRKRVIDAQERYHTAKTRRPDPDAAWVPMGLVLISILGIVLTHGHLPDWVVPSAVGGAWLVWSWLRRD